MNSIEKMFEDFIMSEDYSIEKGTVPESPSKEEFYDEIENLNMNYEKTKQLSDLAMLAMTDHEKQGFINGFKYASMFWKDCIL